jgi:hypothetical protein
MAISLKVNGNSGNEGFLIAPSGNKEFAMPVALKSTDHTTVNATLVVVAPVGVTVKLSSTNVTIGPAGTSVKITAKTPSKSADDIKLQVKVGKSVKASCTLTSIKNVRIRFTGRFQARFATDGDFFNEPRGTTAGWTWALEDEPDFVPATNNIPTQPGMAVGRVVRFQNAVAPRPHVAPIGVTVTAVEGDVGTKTISFNAGDPIIGELVNLGPNTYLAANEPIPAGPQPFETYDPGFEPMENFEIHIGTKFSGKPGNLNERPKANGFFQLTTGKDSLWRHSSKPIHDSANTGFAHRLSQPFTCGSDRNHCRTQSRNTHRASRRLSPGQYSGYASDAVGWMERQGNV